MDDLQKEGNLFYWQKNEVEFIKNNYAKMSCIEMSRYINKKPSSIRWKLRNLEYKPPNHWTNEEIKFIKNNRMVLSFEELAFCLNRTKNAIKAKCKELRLVRPKYNLKLELTDSLAYILGCLCGDASILDNGIRLSVKDKDFADEFYKHCESILICHYIKPIRFKSKGMYYILIGSLAFKNFIIKKYGWFKTINWEIPLEILQSYDKNIIRYFIRGYFDSEGNYHNNSIRVQTICQSLYKIGVLLNKLNIDNKVYKVNRRTKRGNVVYALGIYKEKNINLFKKQIGFTIKRKQQKLCNYLKRVNLNKQKTKYLWKNRKKITRLYEQGYSLKKIANLFNIKSPCTLTLYIKSVIGTNYNIYKLKHLNKSII